MGRRGWLDLFFKETLEWFNPLDYGHVMSWLICFSLGYRKEFVPSHIYFYE